MAGILLRPSRAETWCEQSFLLHGGLTAIVGFIVQVAGLSAGLSTLVTLVGVTILVGLAHVDRRLCGGERWRASFLLREPLPGDRASPFAVLRRPRRGLSWQMAPTSRTGPSRLPARPVLAGDASHNL